MIDNNVLNSADSQLLNKNLKIGPLWEFSRPHTILGTTITVLTLFLITTSNIYAISEHDSIILILTLISSLLANIYIVGLNQIYDIDIDKINKPYLPLASEDLTIKQAKILVVLSGAFSVIFSLFVSFYLLIIVLLGMFIGSLYSIPKTRFKTKPFVASFSISFVRGVLGNIGLYLSYEVALSSLRQNMDVVIIFLTVFVLINSAVIAIFKDIPDIEGDKKYNIRTFTVQLGQQKIFIISIVIILANYFFAIISGLVIAGVWDQFLMVVLHLLAGIIFYILSRKVKPTDKISVWRFYKKIWRFFYVEYIILTLCIIF